MRVLIVDYGMGNLGSVSRAVERFGVEPWISSDPNDINKAERMILPGVGAFADGMSQLHQQGWVNPLKAAVLNQKIPILGICLGMQLLADYGYEGTKTAGLGLIPGEVRHLERTDPTERIPHVGWNEVIQKQSTHALFNDIPDRADFYFVHSYHFIPANQDHVIATTPYCGTMVSAVSDGLIFGTQFHPEKSSKTGLQLLQNFLKIQVLDDAH